MLVCPPVLFSSVLCHQQIEDDCAYCLFVDGSLGDNVFIDDGVYVIDRSQY
jgi:hypothetical protein